MSIPCKDCLVLAACKQREEVECSDLYDWIDVNININAELLSYLPNWTTVKGKPLDRYEGMLCWINTAKAAQ